MGNARGAQPPLTEPPSWPAETGSLAAIHSAIADYYTGKIERHGPTPLGVDWTCVPTQEMRFVQLLRLCDLSRPFSLNDLGCGYGAVLAYIARRHRRLALDYLGVDLSAAMIDQARRRWRRRTAARFIQGHQLPRVADYAMASGIFNVQLGHTDEAWHAFVAATLRDLHAASRIGFAVNFVLPPAPGIVPLQGLYRTLPAPWVDFCTRALEAEVVVLEGYGLREFTLLVKRGLPA